MRNFVGRVFGSVVLVAVVGLAGCAARGPETTGSISTSASLHDRFVSEGQAVDRAIDVHDAIARVLLFNRDLDAERMAQMAAEAEAGLAKVEMLPGFVTSSQVYTRSNSAASASAAATTPSALSGYSVSSDRVSRSREMAVSWSVLDFGISYFRSRQASHRAEAAADQRRRAAALLVEQTRVVFWRAVALQTLDAGLRRIDGEMNRSIDNADRLRAAGLTDPMEALTAERDLLSIRRELDQQRRLLIGAEDQLRSMMNWPAEAPLRLVRGDDRRVPSVGRPSFTALAQTVIENRPEIRQAMADEHITAEEAKIALLELFPNLELVGGNSFDANPYLLNHGWLSLATRASWQLMKIVQYPAKSGAIEAKSELDRLRTRALAAALVLQAQVALSRLEQSRLEWSTLGRLTEVQLRLALQTAAQAKVGRVGSQAATRERMSALLAEARRDAAWGEVQGSWAVVLTSFGIDLADSGSLGGVPPEALAQRLRETEARALASPVGFVRVADRSAAIGEGGR